jgi:hypothetical protein
MAVYANLTADQGSLFLSTVSVADVDNNPIDLTNYTYRGQARRTYNSTTAYDFTVTSTFPTTGELNLQLGSVMTTSMKPGRYVYDIEIIAASTAVTRVLEGQLEITPRVTRTA